MEQEKLANQKETLVFLNSKYPKCFFLDGQVKPLKIGIFQDLAKDLADLELVSKRLLRQSLRHYTSSWRYLSVIKPGVPRVDLAGEEGDTVEQQHADHAAEQLKESKAKAAKYREAKLKETKKTIKHKGYDNKTASSVNNSNKSANAANSNAKRTNSEKTKTTVKKAIKHVVHEPIIPSEILVGNTALVKLGREPMPVTITDVSKDGISVQLKSGMTVKVQSAQLYSDSKAGNT